MAIAQSVTTPRLRVLVIDDDDVAREMLVGILKKEGHLVFELPSAIGATREIFQQNIDAIVLDVMMPDINGDKLARLLRQNSRGRNLAIVLVSGCSSDELRALAAAARADAVVSKREVRAGLARAVLRAYQLRSKTGPALPQGNS